MELTTYNQCACASCGHVIDYRASEAGEIVECPVCQEKSRLPEPEKLTIMEVLGPPIPATKTCAVCGNEMRFLASTCPACEIARKRKFQFTCLLICTLVVGLLVVLAMVHPFRKSRWAGALSNSSPGAPAASGPVIIMEQPRPRMPKSTNDFKVGRFTLEKKRGSDPAIVVGDIENNSENVHTRLRADLDLLDRNGVKIGTASDYFTELGPHQNWHFLATTTQTNALNVRFAGIKED